MIGNKVNVAINFLPGLYRARWLTGASAMSGYMAAIEAYTHQHTHNSSTNIQIIQEH